MRGFVTVLMTMAAVGLAAGDALAGDYCVANGSNTPPNCPAGADTSMSFPQAIAAAQASTAAADRIFLAAGTYTDQSGSDFSFNSGGPSGTATNDLDIIGAGTQATTVTESPAHLSPTGVIAFTQSTSAADQTVRDLTISLPDGFAGSAVFDPTGLTNVDVVAQGAMSGVALRLSNRGTFSGIHAILPLTGGNLGVYQPNGSLTLADATITADNATDIHATSDAMRGVVFHARSQGVRMVEAVANAGTPTALENVQIAMDGPSAALVVNAGSGAGYTGTVNASHLTVFGDGSANSIGVAAGASATEPATLNLSNSAIANVQTATAAFTNGASLGTINLDHSVLANQTFAGNGATVIAGTGHVAFADPKLLLAGGLYHPEWDSPALDLGDPATTTLTTDLAGAPRTVDADGDGTATPDAGAVEYQRQPPTASALAAGPFLTGAATAFQGAGSDPDPGDTLDYAWTFSDGAKATGPNVSHAFAADGPFTGTLRVFDPTGLSATAVATGTDATPPVTVAPPPPAKDTTAPTVSGAAFSPSRFRVSAKDTATSAATSRAPAGSTLRLTLSEPATLTLVVHQKRSGRTAKGHCGRPSRANRGGKRCTYDTTRATLTRRAPAAGAVAIAFSGRVARKALPVGSYRTTITPKDAAGNVGPAASASFTLVH